MMKSYFSANVWNIWDNSYSTGKMPIPAVGNGNLDTQMMAAGMIGWKGRDSKIIPLKGTSP